jgi:hypothetical protein
MTDQTKLSTGIVQGVVPANLRTCHGLPTRTQNVSTAGLPGQQRTRNIFSKIPPDSPVSSEQEISSAKSPLVWKREDTSIIAHEPSNNQTVVDTQEAFVTWNRRNLVKEVG